MYDIDNEKSYQDFLSLSDEEYVVFRSSKNDNSNNYSNSGLTHGSPPPIPYHYWIFIDNPMKKASEYFDNVNWNVLCDIDYKVLIQKKKKYFARFNYINMDRKPIKIHETKNSSPNFKLFIEKFIDLINDDGLKISALRYKDPNLLYQYQRVSKLKRILT